MAASFTVAKSAADIRGALAYVAHECNDGRMTRFGKAVEIGDRS